MKLKMLAWIGVCVLFINTSVWADAIVADTDPEDSDQLFAWIKLGMTGSGRLDYDGAVSNTVTGTDGDYTTYYGMADADVSRVGGGSVKAVAKKYYHTYNYTNEDMGLADNGLSQGIASATYKPFMVTSNSLDDGASTTCSMTVTYDGLIVLNEQQTGEYSSSQIDFSFEILNTTTTDGDDICYEGQLRIEDAYDGTTHTYTAVDDMAPDTIVNLDFPDENEDNYWASTEGSTCVTIIEIDASDLSYTVVQGDSGTTVPSNIITAISSEGYNSDTSNKIYYILFEKTVTFNASVGSTYWVSMDSHAAAQTSNMDADLAGNETLVVCDFSNTAAYDLSIDGGSAQTWIEIADTDAFGDSGTGTAEINGAVMEWSANVALGNDLALSGTTNTTIDTDYTASVGSISGTAGLIKTGTGTLTLAEDCTFTGDTSVEGGTLVVNGAYQSDITVAGGTLGGSGTFQAITATSGTIAPGNSIGTMTLSDAFVLNGGTLEVELDDSGNADKIVAPSAQLTSGTIRAVPTEVISSKRDYTIIDTTSGVTGDLASISQDISDRSYLLDFELSVVGNDLILSATQVQSFADMTVASSNPVLGDVAAILDNAVTAGNGGTQVAALQALGETSLNEAVRQLQPSASLAAGQIAQQQAGLVGQSITGRIATVQLAMRRANQYYRNYALVDASYGSLPMIQSIKAAQMMVGLPSLGQWIGFGRSLNNWGKVASDSVNSGYRWRTHGVDMGLQNLLDENTLVGASVTYLDSSVHGFDSSGTSETSSLYSNLYWSRFTDQWHVDAGASYVHGWTETSRPVTSINVKADGKYESDGLGVFMGGGLVRQWKTWEVDTFLTCDYHYREDGGYTENGAGSLNLTVHRNSTDSLRQTLGTRLTHSLFPSEQSRVYARLSAAWEHEYLDKRVAGDVDLLGQTFRSYSHEMDRDSALLSAGLDWYTQGESKIYLDYTARLNADVTSHQANIGIKLIF